MLAAASAKEDANPKFCHDLSVWRGAGIPSIAGVVPMWMRGYALLGRGEAPSPHSVIFLIANFDLMAAVFEVITIPAMEGEVEVVGRQKVKRMKSSVVVGQSVGHKIGGT